MNTLQETTIQSQPQSSEFHALYRKYILWAHLPHDTNWGIQSYKRIFAFESVEETIAITETVPETLVKNCMLFVMKQNIMPLWEDPQNRSGGFFSYKISNKIVYDVWCKLVYMLVGESLSEDNAFLSCITGISISPKKNFCIIKIWMSSCRFQNPEIINYKIKGFTSQGCLFTKISPED